MSNLKHLFNQPLPLPNKTAIFLLVVALLGFADATYLTVEHYRNVIPPCTVVAGCEVVLTSAYSHIAGIPVSLLGSIFYFIFLVGIVAYLEGKNQKMLRAALVWTVTGFLFSVWFLIVQAFILNAYCLYCLGSALTSTILFVSAVTIFKKYSHQ